MTCFAVGSYLLVVETMKGIRNDFRVMCEKVSTRNVRNVYELKKHFHNMIDDVAEMKKLSD